MHTLSKLAVLLSAAVSFRSTTAGPIPVEDTSSLLEPRWGSCVKPSGRLFNIDGKTQYFSGVNAWWLGHLYNNPNVDQAMQQIASSGYKTARVWAFGNTNTPATETNIYYQTLNSSGQYFNFDPARGIPRLDYVVQKAEKLGLKLIMTLLNNFDALGGINTYTTAFGNIPHNAFYTDSRSQDAYKKYIKFIINRYRNSNAIFSWELMNEPRCSGCDSSIITNWASDVSKYIKSLDREHMVSLGDEGWLPPSYAGGDGSYAYSGYEGVDFIKNLAIPTLDYGTVHMYPNQWGYGYDWGIKWILQHNEIGKAANKPVVLEEYSAPTPELRAQWMPQYQDTIVKKTSLASDMVWQFGTHFPDGNNPFDEYAIYYDTDPNSEYQKFMAGQAKRMAAKPPVANL